MSQTTIHPASLRRALGSFVTGVTVVTTLTPEDDPVGLTVNSFNAVSLSPPLVLWSLSRRAASYDAFVQASHFAVNVLAEDQAALSERFARTGGDKFTGVAWRSGLTGMPLLDGTVASFVCRNAHRYPGGDHLIFVGEVLAMECSARMPLVYAGGRYRELEPVARPVIQLPLETA
jgi:3-hydroxy-9,10-secoandrosta-1,3,5(10)-triene-9,17-dione monooxygenase reductase component